MMRRDTIGIAGALLALALALRVHGVAEPPYYTGDEGYHVPAAKQFLASGQTETTTWSQPPLALVLLGLTIELVGDGPWGWRLRSVVLGSLAALGLALLGGALFPDRRRVGWIAGVLLALEPLHVLLSRSTLEEVQTATFFLFAAWLTVRHLRTGRPGLVLAGVLLGCAHASKAYYHVAGLVLLAALLVALHRRGAPPGAYVHAVLCFTIVPATVYLAAYLPWFRRGYTLAEFLEVQRAAWHAVGAKTLDTFVNGPMLATAGRPGSWFLRPALFGFRLPSAPEDVRLLLFAKNPLTWLAVLPAAAAVATRAGTRREPGEALLLAVLAATYVPLLLLARPIFLYSAVAVLPFGLLAIARVLDLVWDRSRALAVSGLLVVCAASLYLYPVATGLAVPPWAYLPVLGGATLFGG
jgi:dolichyl-phosphate-mannose-protein mannosyltransferase